MRCQPPARDRAVSSVQPRVPIRCDGPVILVVRTADQAHRWAHPVTQRLQHHGPGTTAGDRSAVGCSARHGRPPGVDVRLRGPSEVAMDVTAHRQPRSDARAPGGGHHGRHDSESGCVVTLVRVLLLNASHEPLAVVTGRRALVLVVAGKAECVLERPTASLIRSPSVAVAVPAVVRLRRYVRVPYPAPPAVTRAGMLRRDSPALCLLPWSRGHRRSCGAQEPGWGAFVGELRRLLRAVQCPQGRSPAGRAGLVVAVRPGAAASWCFRSTVVDRGR